MIRKRKRLIWSAGALGLALAFAVCLLMGRQYLATTTVEIEKIDASQTNLRLNAAVAPPSNDEMKTDIATHMSVLQSPNVLLAVVRDLKLQDEAPFKIQTIADGVLRKERAHRRRDQRGLPLEQAPLLARPDSRHLPQEAQDREHAGYAADHGAIP